MYNFSLDRERLSAPSLNLHLFLAKMLTHYFLLFTFLVSILAFPIDGIDNLLLLTTITVQILQQQSCPFSKIPGAELRQRGCLRGR